MKNLVMNVFCTVNDDPIRSNETLPVGLGPDTMHTRDFFELDLSPMFD